MVWIIYQTKQKEHLPYYYYERFYFSEKKGFAYDSVVVKYRLPNWKLDKILICARVIVRRDKNGRN